MGVGGINWLEHEIREISPSIASGYARLITRTMAWADSLSELMQWTNCLRECVIKGATEEYAPAQALESILEEQSKQRPLVSSEPNSQYSYVREWSDAEWDQWKEHVKELISDLKETLLYSSHSDYPKDPDGICVHGNWEG